MGLVHQAYKVAVVQAAPVWLDLDATVDKTIALIEEAAARGREADRVSRDLHSRISVAHLARRSGLGDRPRLRAALFRQLAVL